MSITKRMIRDLRAMSDEYHRLMRAGLPTDPDELTYVAELTNMLACSVPHLLDALEQGVPAAPDRSVKMDLGRAGIA